MTSVDKPVTSAAQRRLPPLALLLAVSPALAASTRAIYGLVFGGTILAVLSFSTLALALLGPLVGVRSRLLLHVAVGAVLVTVADVCLAALAPAIRQELGVAFPLGAASCVLVGRAVLSGRPAPLGRSVGEAAGLGLGIAACLFGIACAREALGSGTLTLPSGGRFGGVLTLGRLADHPVAVMAQAAGALLTLGFLMGLARWIADKRRKS